MARSDSQRTTNNLILQSVGDVCEKAQSLMSPMAVGERMRESNLLVEFNAVFTLPIHALFSKKDSSLSAPTLPTLLIHAKFSTLGIVPYAEENAEGD